VPTFQDDQLNGNGWEISQQKQTFSHVSRSAGLTYEGGWRLDQPSGIRVRKRLPGFRYYEEREREREREREGAYDWAVACMTLVSVTQNSEQRGIDERARRNWCFRQTGCARPWRETHESRRGLGSIIALNVRLDPVDCGTIDREFRVEERGT